MRRDAVTWSAYATLGVFGVGLGLLGPAVPYLRAEYGLRFAAAALHLTGFSVGATIGSGLTGALGHRCSRRSQVVGGLTALGLGGLLVAVAASPVISVAATVLMGAGGVVAQIVMQAVLGDQHREHAGVAMNEGHIVASLGLVGAAVALAAGASVGWWRGAFVVPLVLGAPLALATVRAPLPSRVIDSGGRPPRGVPWPVWLGAAATGLGVATEWAVSFWAASYLHEEVGMRVAVAGLATGGVFAMIVASRLLTGRLATRTTSATLLRGAAGLVALGALPYLFAPSTTDTLAPVIAVAGLAILGLGIGPLFPLSVALTLDVAAAVDTGMSDRASGAATGAGAVAGIAFPVLLGTLADATSLRGALFTLPVLAAGVYAAVAGSARRGGPRTGSAGRHRQSGHDSSRSNDGT